MNLNMLGPFSYKKVGGILILMMVQYILMDTMFPGVNVNQLWET